MKNPRPGAASLLNFPNRSMTPTWAVEIVKHPYIIKIRSIEEAEKKVESVVFELELR